MQTQSLGRNLLFGMNMVTALNGLVADWNRTHLFNKKWPPHAKYHDAMGLSMGVLLGGVGIYALQRKVGHPRDNLDLSAMCPAIFFVAMMTAQAFPNADTIETEFPDYWPKIGRFSFNEVPFATSMLALVALGWKMASSPERESSDPIGELVEESDRTPIKTKKVEDHVAALRVS